MKEVTETITIRKHMDLPDRGNRTMNMFIIEKKDNWEVPEGIMTAKYVETRVLERIERGKTVTIIRPVFEITSLCSPRHRYLVSKNYKSSDPSQLKADFEHWLGDEFYDLVDERGIISRESLDSLIGREADLHVVHIQNTEYKAPFRHLAAIAPPGSLTGLN